MEAKLSLRDISVEVIKNLPPSSSLEEIMYQINFAAKILEGLNEESNGELIQSKDLIEQIKTWQPK